MPTCVFDTNDVKRCVEHALQATAHEMPFMKDETPTPALLFVHDSGVYVMSNGIPRDVIGATGKHERCYVAYADNTNPTEYKNWWQNSADLVGGDDFVEVLPITQQWLEDCDVFEELFVDVENNKITAGFRGRKNLAKNAV